MDNQDIEYIIESLHPFEREALAVYKKTKNKTLSSQYLAENAPNLDLNKANRAINWLMEKKFLITTTDKIISYQLTKIGEETLEKGLPESRLLKWLELHPNSIEIAELASKTDLDDKEYKIAFGLLKKLGFIQIDKGKVQITKEGLTEAKKTNKSKENELLGQISKEKTQNILSSQESIDNLVKRGLIEKITNNLVSGTLTELGLRSLELILDEEEYIEQLTREMIINGDWKNKKLRHYKVDVPVPPYVPGKRHFYWQAIDYARQVWLSMGFEEMEGPICQTSFWVFDALYTPQDHPAREAQDTFFLKQPLRGRVDDLDYKNVAETHETGGKTGSQGWGGRFSRDIAETIVLRTHTTCLSIRTIKQLRDKGYPAKYFAIGRCFRNERIDWKHLAEFDQVEGIVIDPDVTFQDLLGYLKAFYFALGFSHARFRPAFYPYTEPSVGIDVYHPIKKQWIELGGAGVFRPEVVVPILGEDIPVLAWGPGIARIVMERYNLGDVRIQYENDIDQLKQMPIWMR